MTTVTPQRLPRALTQVGRSLPRVDAAEKLRGEAVFVGDIRLPGMLHGKVLRSPLPHARIRSHRSRARPRPCPASSRC